MNIEDKIKKINGIIENTDSIIKIITKKIKYWSFLRSDLIICLESLKDIDFKKDEDSQEADETFISILLERIQLNTKLLGYLQGFDVDEDEEELSI